MKTIQKWHLLGRLFASDRPALEAPDARLSGDEWRSVAAFSVDHLVGPELYWHLSRMGALSLLPDDVVQGLEGAAELNALLHDDLRVVFSDLVHIANTLDILPVLVKGGIDVMSPHDSINASRLVSDLDVLVHPEDAARLHSALQDAGWRVDSKHPEDTLDYYLTFSHHYPPLWHPSLAQYVEIHARLGPTAAERDLGARILERAGVRTSAGGRFAVPSREDRIEHNALHHFRGVFSAKNFAPQSFRQSLDFWRLCALPEGAGLQDMMAREDQTGASVRLSVALAGSLFGGALPAADLRRNERLVQSMFFAGLDSRLVSSCREALRQGYRLRSWHKLFSCRYWRYRARLRSNSPGVRGRLLR